MNIAMKIIQGGEVSYTLLNCFRPYIKQKFTKKCSPFGESQHFPVGT